MSSHHINPPNTILPKLTVSPFEILLMCLSILAMLNALCLAFMPLKPIVQDLLIYVDSMICSIFLCHWFFHFMQASNKKKYLSQHWLDLIASIPAVEPLRMARIFQVLRIIRVLRSSRHLLKSLYHRRETTLFGLMATIAFILTLSSIMILVLESHLPESNIKTAEQAIWWALVTISTVGYGDFYPVTTLGKIFAGLLIFCGVSFFGILSGYMASLFITPKTPEQFEHEELKSMLCQIERQQAAILQQLQQHQTDKTSSPLSR
jgi:voltage-gated potassium channel